MGRPATYTEEIADKVLTGLIEGKSLREVCKGDDMPPESTVRLWALDDREGFAARYARAREIGYHAMADDLLEIADDGKNDWMIRRNAEGDESAGWEANGEHLQRSRLRVDTRKWMLSKVLPKVYGDRLALGGAEDMPPIQTQEVERDADTFTSRLARLAAAKGTGEGAREADPGDEGGS